MPEGVYTLNKRISFVKGWLTGGTDPADGSVECGDDTAYPMLVTLDQIAEIFYRVKDAQFTAGSLDYVYSGFSQSILPPANLHTNRAYEKNSATHVYRGYTAQSNAIEPPTSYLTNPYNAGNSIYFQDIANRESAIYLPKVFTSPGYYGPNGTDFYWSLGQINAFSYYSKGSVPNIEDYYWFHTSPAGYADNNVGLIEFNGKVAVIKVNPTDSDVAPTNLYYLGVFFYAETFPPIGPGTWASSMTEYVDPTGTNATYVCDYVIKLSSSSEARCKIYIIDDIYDSVDGSDFVHQAVEWWPYAKNSPSEPVWGLTTGLKL